MVVWRTQAINPDYCNYLVQKLNEIPKESASVYKEGDHDLNTNVRRSSIAWVFDNEVKDMVDWHAFNINRMDYGFDIAYRNCHDIQYTEYRGDVNGTYDWHDDLEGPHLGKAFERKLSIIIQLTDPSQYTGGDLELMNIDLTDQHKDDIKMQGTIIAFPSFVKHRVSPVTSGIRNSLVTWLEGPPWR